jgi:hypothetical protein
MSLLFVKLRSYFTAPGDWFGILHHDHDHDSLSSSFIAADLGGSSIV